METNIRCDICGYENIYTLPESGGSLKLICKRCKADLGTVYDHGCRGIDTLWECCSKLLESSDSDDQYQQIAKEIGDLVSRRQKTYGNSFGRASEVLKILYPDGIKLEQYNDIMTITRMLDKVFRISQGHLEDSYEDICGYAILGAARSRNNEKN